MPPFRLRQTLVTAALLAGLATLLVKEPVQYSHGAAQSSDPSSTSAVQPATCAITEPPSKPFIPPAPYPKEVTSAAFWIGTEKLWTNLRRDGLWHGYWVTDQGLGVKHKIYADKISWWRKGYDWKTEDPPRLKVSGRRLDAPAAPFSVGRVTNAFIKHPAMLTLIDIPTVGCWEITGDYKGDKLTFVVWVVDPPSNVP